MSRAVLCHVCSLYSHVPVFRLHTKLQSAFPVRVLFPLPCRLSELPMCFPALISSTCSDHLPNRFLRAIRKPSSFQVSELGSVPTPALPYLPLSFSPSLTPALPLLLLPSLPASLTPSLPPFLPPSLRLLLHPSPRLPLYLHPLLSLPCDGQPQCQLMNSESPDVSGNSCVASAFCLFSSSP